MRRAFRNLLLISALSATLTIFISKNDFKKSVFEVNKEKNIICDVDKNIEVSNMKKCNNNEKKEGKVAYITIDDGPSKYTNSIIEILNKNDVKATFFCIDRNMKKYPSQLKNMLKHNHKIGLHGVTHDVNSLYKTTVSARNEFDKNNHTLYNITGEYTSLVRLPYGSKPHMPNKTYNNLVKCGYKIWDWTIDTEDWKSSSEEIVENVKVNSKNKDNVVILIHEKKQTVQCLEEIITYLKEQGYEFKTIDEKQQPVNYWIED